MSATLRVPRWCVVVAVVLWGGACRTGASVGGNAVPAGAPAPAAAAAVDLTKPPTLGPPPSLTLPPIVKRELPNGLGLYIVEQHELPVVDFVLLVRTGGEADPRDRGGLASITADMLDEGTTTRSALEIADQEAYLGVELGTGSGWDASEVSLHTTTEQLDSALALFGDVVLHPAFPSAELERIRKERLTALIQLRDRGPAIADRAFASIVFGDAHPYGHPLTGTDASVAAITREDVQRFYETYYRPNNATLIVVGDVRPDDVERRVRALLGGWEARAVPATEYGNPPAPTSATIVLIDKPHAPQSSFRIGAVGVARSTPDYFPIEVMNTILGGVFTSRLNQNLRETHGYTYGASSGFAMRRSAGPFIARAEVVAAKTDSALLEFMKELRAIHDTVPRVELERAKRYLELQLPGQFESTGDIARQLAPLALYDLPLDFYDQYVRRVDQVTQRDVQRVADRYVNPTTMQIVIVGDRASIEGKLRALDLAPVSVRSIDGTAVTP
ncbi:MAG: insulinase family protein [Gemmatimonadaceae bacterium]|nr:insulinase family protein [Gemmatimonadaceae bacterium]